MIIVSKALSKLKLSKRVKRLPYEPLPSVLHTRLLEKLTTSGNNLTFRLITIDTSKIDIDEVCFNALSYTWGPPLSTPQCIKDYGPKHNVDIAVVIGDVHYTMTIGRNLFEALQHIDSPLPLWVDAICIDQANAEEKSQHILRMSAIYSMATNVLVWLGPDDRDTKHILWLHTAVLDDLQSRFGVEPIQRELFKDSKDGGIGIIGDPDYFLPKDALLALYKFYAERRYFTRAWVVQEIALARCPILLLGGFELQFDRLDRLGALLGDMGGLVDLYMQRDGAGNLANGSRVGHLQNTANQFRGWTNLMKPDLQSLYGARDDYTSILALLLYSVTQPLQLEATDPRDLIYSRLGLARALEPVDVITPDYTASVDEVFMGFAATLLKNLPLRSILSSVAAKKPHSEYVSSLPSWVPDLATCAITMPAQFRIQEITGELPKQSFDLAPLHIDGRRLSLRARRCGTIQTSFQVHKLMTHDLAEFFLGDVRWIAGILRKCSDADLKATLRVLCYGAPLDGDAVFEFKWRKFFMACVLEVSAVVEDYDPTELLELYGSFNSDLIPDDLDLYLEKQFTDYLTTVPPAERKLEDFTRISPHIKTEEDLDDFIILNTQRVDPVTTSDTTFFRTASRTGRIMNAVKAGDELWWIEGTIWPFILRPKGEDFLLMGEAYVWEFDVTEGEELIGITLV